MKSLSVYGLEMNERECKLILDVAVSQCWSITDFIKPSALVSNVNYMKPAFIRLGLIFFFLFHSDVWTRHIADFDRRK